MTETDISNPEVELDDDKPQRSSMMVTISKILMFAWGVLIGVVILNPFGFALDFIHYALFALVTFLIIIFYNGMNPREKPDTVEVTNYVEMK